MSAATPSIHLNSQKLPKLISAADYYRWREEATDVFLQKTSKVWRIVKGELPRPTTDDDKYGEWIDANNTAVGLIRSSLSMEIKHTIKDLDDAHAIWKELERGFAKTMTWRLEELETEFNSLRQERLSIDAFVAKIKELSEQLQLGGVEVTMHKKYTVLMKGLRREYENIKAQIKETYRNHRERSQMTVRRLVGPTAEEFVIINTPVDEKAEFDSIVAKLRSKELQLGLGGHVLTQRPRQHMSAAFLTAAPNRSRQGQRGPPRNQGARRPKRRVEDITCYRCQEKGHYANKCTNPRKEDDRARGQPRGGSHQTRTGSRQTRTGFDQPRGEMTFSAVDVIPTDTALNASNLESTSGNMWIIDTGSTSHICTDADAFSELDAIKGRKICSADNVETEAAGVGTVVLHVKLPDGSLNTITLKDVLYIPTYAANLLSFSRFQDKCDITITKTKTIASIAGRVVCQGHRIGNLTYLDTYDDFVALSTSPSKEITLWHNRLAHASMRRTRDASKIVTGMPALTSGADNPKCNSCEVSKSHSQPFTSSTTKTNTPLELVHSDVVGKMPDATFRGEHFAVMFTDDFTRHSVVFLMRQKSEVFGHFQEYKTMMENQTGKTIKRFRSDNGGEYTGEVFESFLRSHGIIHETSAPYTPEQNGVAERLNRTLFDMTRSMLYSSGAPAFLWGEALLHATYLHNRLPTRSLVGTTPLEALTGRKPNLSILSTFGCSAWAHIPKERRLKLDERAVPTVMIGIANDTKGYKLLDPQSRTVLVTRHATFDEGAFPFKKKSLLGLLKIDPTPITVGPDREVDAGEIDSHLIEPSTSIENHAESPPLGSGVLQEAGQNAEVDDGIYTPPGSPPAKAMHIAEAILPEKAEFDVSIGQPASGPAQPDRMTADPPRVNELSAILDDEPRTIAQAMKRPDWPKWEEAIAKELQSHKDNNTWTVVDQPRGKSVIGSRWVFKVKRRADGGIDKYKARLVAQGYTQKQGIDYDETFAPVVKISTLRLLIIIAVMLGLDIYQMDVVTAYLNAPTSVELYIELPPGLDFDAIRAARVGLLNSCLYGLKQSGREWYHHIRDDMIEMGFDISEFDAALFYKPVPGDMPIIVTIYVDDILIFAKRKSDADKIMQELRARFKMTGGDKLAYILGIQVQTRDGFAQLVQSSYTQRLLTLFGLDKANPVHTPFDPKGEITHGAPLSATDHSTYRTMVGSILYLATCTRPDVAYAVQRLSRCLAAPTAAAMVAAKHLLRYLKGTIDVGLVYRRPSGKPPIDWGTALLTYSDADHAGDKEMRRSTSGIVNTIAGMPYSWTSKRQSIVTDSTCYAEYVAMAEASKEIVWARNMLADLGLNVDLPTPLRADNEAAIQLAANPRHHNRTKHIDIKYHFVREQQVEFKTIEVVRTASKYQLADMFTKPLDRLKAHENRTQLGITEVEDPTRVNSNPKRVAPDPERSDSN